MVQLIYGWDKPSLLKGWLALVHVWLMYDDNKGGGYGHAQIFIYYLIIPPTLLQDAMDHEYFNDLSETIRHM